MFVNAALALALLQQGGEADTARAAADSAAVASAYLDEDAREMVRLARERRQLVDRSVEHYTATAKERISLGLRALRRDRLFYRREIAARIDWTRNGPVHIDVLGAREVIPAVFSKARVPEDIDDFGELAFDPAADRMMVGWGEDDDDFVRHPFASGAEAHYRFRAGDTTVIALPDGRRVRLRELEIIPRRKDVHLIRGSFWLDAESHGVVQAGFRLADEFDLERDVDDPEDVDEVPGILKPIRASVQYITIEYGLWDLRWWLPRLVAFEGVGTVGRFLSLPLQYERVYSDYEVTGAAEEVPLITVEEHAAQTELLHEYCRERWRAEEEAEDDEEDDDRRRGDAAARDTGAAAGDASRAADEPPPAPADTALPAELRALFPDLADPCDRYTVNMPSDSTALITSELLPPDPYASGVAMVSTEEIRELTDRLKDIAPVPWQLEPPSIDWGLGGPGLLRYNRVEALSIGVQTELDLGRLTATGSARIGVADLEPNAELAVARETFTTRYELGGYRRLASMDAMTQPFTFTSSLSALLLGRDEVDYFRTLGVELRGRPVEAQPQWYEWRLYAQRERPAKKETDFSLAHALDGDHVFPDNAQAERATQYGLDLVLKTWHGHDPLGFRWGAELGVNAATGTFDYARPSLTFTTAWPLPRGLAGALEVAGGTTFGRSGEQHLWRLGGVPTLRGYPHSVTTGESFWRARAEIATRLPAARLVLFTDLGSAGDTDQLFDLRPLLAAGVGASFLDGLFRIDLARALRRPTGWRLTMSVDGRL